jgi:hypothetical protein
MGSARVWLLPPLLLVLAGCWDFGWSDDHTAAGAGRSMRVAVRSDPVFVAAGETLRGDLIVVGGDAKVDGEVQGDLVVVAGRLWVGPQAVVQNDLVAVGNDVTEVAPGARVGKSQVAVNFPGIRWMVDNTLLIWDNPLLTALVALVGIAFLLWLAYVILVKRYDSFRFHGTIENHPVRAGSLGMIIHFAFGALALAAFLGRWTIGLVPPLIAAGFILGFIGWLMGAVHVGRLIAVRRGWSCGAFTYGLLGFVIVGVASLVPVIGQIGAFILSLIGIGALVAPSRRDELPAPPRAPSAVPIAPMPIPIDDLDFGEGEDPGQEPPTHVENK